MDWGGHVSRSFVNTTHVSRPSGIVRYQLTVDSGKAFGVFNVKWLFLGVVTLFELGSAVCGAAPSMDAFIIGRVLQGIGACGCYAGAVTFVSLTTSTRERPIYISGVLATWSVGSVVGPVIGGAFAQSSATWRWAFYINIVFAAFTAPWLILYLPNIDPAKDLSFKEKMMRQDWLGIVIFMGGATCLSLGLTFGGTVYSWNSAPEIVLWTLSGVLLIVFLLVTIYHPTVTLRDRLYPLHLMKRLELNLLELALSMASGCMVTTLYYIPLLFQFTRNDGPLKAGARLMPFLAGLIFFSILNGALMPKWGYHMPWYVVGTAMILVGTTLMSNNFHLVTSMAINCKKVSSMRQPPRHIFMVPRYLSEVAVELSFPQASQSSRNFFQTPSLAML